MNTLWGKTVTNQPTPGPKLPLRCLDNITNYSRNSEPRIYHLSESNAFFVFRFMRKFLSCQNMFRFFLRQKRRSAFSQRTPFCLWSWWLRLNSLWLIQWSINRIVTGHHCDYDNSLFYYWSTKAFCTVIDHLPIWPIWKGVRAPRMTVVELFCRPWGRVLDTNWDNKLLHQQWFKSGTNCTKKWQTVRQPLFGHHDPI